MVTGDISIQTRRALDSLSEVLKASGSSLEDVVKTTVFLADIEDFPAVNKVFEELFPSNPPARSVVQVSALPKGARLEIEAIAVKKD